MTPGAESVRRRQVPSHQTHLTPISTVRPPKKSIQQYKVGSVKMLLVPFMAGNGDICPSVRQCSICTSAGHTYMKLAVCVYDSLGIILEDSADLLNLFPPFYCFNQSFLYDVSRLE